MFTGLFAMIYKLLIGLYLGRSDVTESFAVAGSLMVLLARIYYAARGRRRLSNPPPVRRAAGRWRRHSPRPSGHRRAR